ncbi:HNH endonuclease signature motif containing protein [Microbacterium sp. JZ31]|uniref:HNH endonuclease signature motif containing protein n=1 Tax=Microbacterium sp. JZ31 TaxID=1906274 RepID=UPI00193126F6|nr:HNH endonuclease signature motif containing protein [Microbacterium sp. JZ31]
MTTQGFSSGSWVPTTEEHSRASALVEAYAEVQGQMARLQAESALILAELAGIAKAQSARSGSTSDHKFAFRSMAAEVASVVRVPDATVRVRMCDAVTLVSEFPATFAALGEGRVSDAHARVITAAGARLDEGARTEYEGIVLARAENTTAAALRPIAKALAERIDPLPLTARHERAMDARGVWLTPLEDGMGELRIVAPAVLVFGAHDRLTQMARVIKRAADGQERTMDHIRADVATDLILTGAPTSGDGLDAIRAAVQVSIPADTLLGLGDDSALLAGYGPIDPDAARRLATRAPTWVRLFTDPDTGCLRTVDTHTPTASQRRFLVARDEHCRFPGCRQPARRSDLDHTVAHAERGRTTVTNLAHLCETHHMLKHHSPWRMHQGEDGVIEWISPLGRTYTHAATPVVRFQALAQVIAPVVALEDVMPAGAVLDLVVAEPAPF